MGAHAPLRRVRIVAALLLVIVGWLVGGPADGALASEAKANGEERPVTLWHIPHPDDETLGMAGGILEAGARGERNVVVLYTQGGLSDVRLLLNGHFYCRLHGRYHDPEAEGYVPLDVDAFMRARTAETIAALAHLGVDEDDVIVLDFADGALQVDPAFAMMIELDRLFPGARHRTTSVFDRHRDHQNLARALNRLQEKKRAEGVELDVAYYRVYQYRMSPMIRDEGDGVRAVVVGDPERKREALDEFALWDPERGRFAVGMHSVPDLFRAAVEDTNEYLDAPDALPLNRLRSAGRLSFKVFSGETVLSYRLAPGWSLRIGAPYTVDALRSALVYERRSPSAAVMLYAGWGAELSREGAALFPLAGLRVVDRFVVEYRPPNRGLGRGSLLQIGWRLDI